MISAVERAWKTTLMKRSLRDAWVAALRSGEYLQGANDLCRTRYGRDRYCCLGVLYDIGVDGHWTLTEKGRWATDAGSTWGIKEYRSVTGLGFIHEYLLGEMGYNGVSFAMLARWIEAKVPVEDDE